LPVKPSDWAKDFKEHHYEDYYKEMEIKDRIKR